MTAVSSEVRAHPDGETGGSTHGPEAKDPHPTPVASTPSTVAVGGWTPICGLDRLQPERGVAALVGGEPVAVFRTHDDHLFALHNVDPFSNASVLSRGIVGDVGGTAVVASPLYKQHFALASGQCVEDPDVGVTTYPVRVTEGTVEIGSP